MNRTYIINDNKFREVCHQYNLDVGSFDIVDDTIIVTTSRPDVVVQMDMNYNVMGVLPKFEGADKYYWEYPDYISAGKKYYHNNAELPYPFQHYNLSQLVNLSNRIKFYGMYRNNIIFVNGNQLEYPVNDPKVLLLGYIKILGDLYKRFRRNQFEMHMLGVADDFPNVRLYLIRIIESINSCIDILVKQGIRPMPADIISYLGIDRESIDMVILYDVIELLVRDKGYILYANKVEVDDKDITTIPDDLTDLADQLINILDKPENLDTDKRMEKVNIDELVTSSDKARKLQ